MWNIGISRYASNKENYTMRNENINYYNKKLSTLGT